MRRRFGRRRRNDEGRRPLDIEQELAAAAEARALPLDSLAAIEASDIAPHLAAVGRGTTPDGSPAIAVVAPQSGSVAWLASLAVGSQLANEEGFRGVVYALSPSWSAGARALLRQTRSLPFEVRALAQPDADGQVRVAPEGAENWAWVLASGPAHGVGDAAEVRLVAALQGLAAKHGGVLQRELGGVRLILLGRPVAVLRRGGAAATLEVLEPRRSPLRVAPDNLSEILDQLEGFLRKFLSDRKIREGEPGLRAAGSAVLADALDLTTWVRWPFGMGDACPVDVLGVDRSGQLWAGALRRELDLGLLAPILEAAALSGTFAAWWFAHSPAASLPRVALAAERFDAPTTRALAALEPKAELFDLSSDARRGLSLRRREWEAAPAAAAPLSRFSQEPEPRIEAAPDPEREASGAERLAADKPPSIEDTEAPGRRYEEVSLFDLTEEDTREDASGARRRRRRRGGRGRSRTSAGGAVVDDEGPASSEDSGERDDGGEAETRQPGSPGSRRSRRRRRRRARPLMVEEVADEESDEDEDTESEGETPIVAEDDAGDEDDAGEGDDAGEDDVDELEERAELLDTDAGEPEEEPEAAQAKPTRAPRRRAAIVAHADRDSVGAAVLLARDLRLLEGIWVYRQEELMTFFRSVATDLRENTPIYLIGFTASPARETLQTASLYRDRLTWFDHHGWPPEDLEGLRQAIDPEAVHVISDGGSSLPLVLELCSRRSRFSDKLVDLLTGRFTAHDYERWGRLWWWRLGDVAIRSGEHRAELQGLITGRPSDLSREARAVDAPPLPPEADFVASRNFPLVHFGGFTLVRVDAPDSVNLALAARIARERYDAQLSLARHEGMGELQLAGENGSQPRSGRSLDLVGMAEHLAGKFDWVELLPSADHIARIRVRDGADRPERIDEVISEIAMGRSVLEG